MLIQVEYTDNKFDFVKNSQLDRLMDMRRINRFKRSTGWVTVGVDPVRKRKNRTRFETSERRKQTAE